VQTTVGEWLLPEDHDSPVPPDGYFISFVSFHKRGLAAPPHQFLYGLLGYYRIELLNC
jgi:hypothetical protein